MLKTIDCSSLEDLMLKVMPPGIYDKEALVFNEESLEQPVSES
jgi:hypothetical protein